MMKLEKVKEGLECCKTSDCGNCPYWPDHLTCQHILNCDCIEAIADLEDRIVRLTFECLKR